MSASVRIIRGPVLEVSETRAASAAGARLSFRGIVRPVEDGKPIAGLRYEAYRPMAENLLRQLCDDAVQRFKLLAIDFTHSEGVVPVGGVSLLIHIDSAHRAESLEAMAWLIDALKRDVPIWKHVVPA